MNISIWFALSALLILFILNMLTGIPVKRRVGIESPFFKRIVESTNGIFFDIFPCIIAFLFSDSWAWVVWIVVIIKGIFLLIEVIQFLVVMYTSIVLMITGDIIPLYEWCTCLSQFYDMVGSIVAFIYPLQFII